MCYDIKAGLEAQLKRAQKHGDLQAIDEIIQKLVPLTDLPLHHATGFNHPEVLIYTNESPFFPMVATWGLVPPWVNDEVQLKKIWNSTINARGETIFEKPSFKNAANNNRCIIYIDGFYEHHHFNGKTFPFFIKNKTGKPLALAGLYSLYKDGNGGKITTFTIVTTKGNSLLEKIHNNPKLSEPRMPLILTEEDEDKWLNPLIEDLKESRIKELKKEYPAEKLEAYTVKRLRGKAYVGNIAEISQPFKYEELTNF
ncbi:SOS response-associated peptidase [Aurantibacter sp.]|uniref:SOS response-associated peptidase n=1 Tax=Aurantibacter sp. TaxID=2807103 RepID=UPI003266906F